MQNDNACRHDHGSGSSANGLKDPVCGMAVSDASSHFSYHEKDYFFCSAGCRSRFAANPEKYLNPAPEPPGDSQAW